MLYNKRIIKSTARTLLVVLLFQLAYPLKALALTTGPSQPEVASFEPVGTTDMVNMFTGNFNYNIPLMDVEGYPINIAYHAGVGMEDEASWVGLGWNINPGAINRTVRGVPDDFNGEELTKELNIKEEKIVRVGSSTGIEVFGAGDPSPFQLSLSAGQCINLSNYQGISVDLTTGVGVSLMGVVSAGINFGIGSQSGADFDPYVGVSVASTRKMPEGISAAGGISISGSHGYNSRYGLKDISLSASANIVIKDIEKSHTRPAKDKDGNAIMKRGKVKEVSIIDEGGYTSTGVTTYGKIPIGMRNYIPVITNSSTMHSTLGRLKIGGEAAWSNFWGAIKGSVTRISHQNNASRKAFGYMYAQNADIKDIHDFSRDKDGMYNKSMQYLPMATNTYDIYSIAGQGTGGSFRPVRNDYGSVFDPVVVSPTSKSRSIQVEASIGWLFGFGTDISVTNTDISSGSWRDYHRQYSDGETSSLYENTYLKQAGDISAIKEDYWNSVGGTSVLQPDDVLKLPFRRKGTEEARDPRSSLVYFFNAYEAAEFEGVANQKYINSYEDTFGIGAPTVATQISRNVDTRKDHQISEIIQVAGDGRRYIYGLPAMNNIQREAVFTVDGGNAKDEGRGLVQFSDQDNSTGNTNGIDNYYSSTMTPSYAHSYLLTSVLSTDYVDLKNDGPTNDDLGSYSKFNYRRTSEDYRWRAPYKQGWGQHNQAFQSDPWDDKASYLIGSREQWMLHSIESKNFIAEFYTSERLDGKGVTEKIPGGGSYNATASSDDQKSYKLDSIKLYNKHDRFLNKTNAIPIKTVFFEYDYSLCIGIPNTSNTDTGKLTLKKIYTRYGNSNRSMASPYQFNYSDFNPDYNEMEKDRWGSYKADNGTMHNNQYPFVNQTDANNDKYSRAWSLDNITLPSGGIIEVNYEADDYAYVQNRRAMEMFPIEGIGNSTTFSRGNQLYFNKRNPQRYLYFKRDKGREIASNSAKDNYLGGTDLLYFNCNVHLVKGKFEQVKGYGKVASVGYCDDDYGYVELVDANVRKSKSRLNPITYSAVNMGRYHLPHIIYEGFDPNMNPSNLKPILAGLKQSFNELLNLFKNPVDILIDRDKLAQSMDLSQSYIRLSSPGWDKTGGGHRVKQLTFYDSWADLAGGDAENASYGKQYDYTTEINNTTVSSGVASYEPMIGGDENPLREPIPYIGRSGSDFPPHEAISLYQETPLGESLYPSAVVGYSKVTISSIHKEDGRSSQAVERHQFYTAKDYPVRVTANPIDASGSEAPKFSLFKVKNKVKVRQGYTVELNDMHGKPKSMELFERKVKGGADKLVRVNYKLYKYNTSNTVDVLERDAQEIVPGSAKMGYDIDVTLDTRQRLEHTKTRTLNMNVNVTNIAFLPIPIPLIFPWTSRQENEFRSAVATKVVQRYGILQEVEMENEGAQTILKNEIYDPTTGQALVTSLSNEYNDKEYSVDYPAYWGYKNMGPAYMNTGYTDTFISGITFRSGYDPNTSTTIASKGVTIDAGSRLERYNNGDEVLLTYNYSVNGVPGSNSIIGYVHLDHLLQYELEECCQLVVMPKYHDSTAYTVGWTTGGTISDIKLKVLRSGRKNLLNEAIQSYTTLTLPIHAKAGVITTGGSTAPDVLNDTLASVITLSAREFSESSINTNTHGNIRLDNFSNGKRGIYRVAKEYTYQVPRIYTDRARKAGWFYAMSPWKVINTYDPYCTQQGVPECATLKGKLSASSLYPDFSSGNWKLSRSVSKWSPYAAELENRDAVNNYSTAVYGYNEELPVAVAYNAQQGEVLFDGFEDYQLLTVENNFMDIRYSPFKNFFTKSSVSGSSGYEVYDISSGQNSTSLERNTAHTGLYALKSSSTRPKIVLNKTNVTTAVDSYLSFQVKADKKYVLSYWARPTTITHIEHDYSGNTSIVPYGNTPKKSKLIDFWQQVEYEFTTTEGTTPDEIELPANCYIDDIRIYPIDGNMKSFVYNPINERLMATLDENNYATFYEYDQEGNLVRTKRETENGIITISESRSANTKQ